MSPLETIERIAKRGDNVLQQVVDVLHDEVDHYSWVGIYFVEGDDLVLGPWRGPQATEHVRIPVGQGVCGATACQGPCRSCALAGTAGVCTPVPNPDPSWNCPTGG